MKHRLTALLLVLALLIATTGCAAARARLDAAEDRVEESLDQVGDAMERAVQQATTPTAAPGQTSDIKLTKEEAEKIALDYLGLTADQVHRLHTEFEIDCGIPQYDVEFHQDQWEYEFEIHAEDGRILSYDKDRHN